MVSFGEAEDETLKMDLSPTPKKEKKPENIIKEWKTCLERYHANFEGLKEFFVYDFEN